MNEKHNAIMKENDGRTTTITEDMEALMEMVRRMRELGTAAPGKKGDPR